MSTDPLAPSDERDRAAIARLERLLAREDAAAATTLEAALDARTPWAWELLDRGLEAESAWAKRTIVMALRVPQHWAWVYLYERYAPPLRARCMARLGSAIRVDALVADILMDFVTRYVHKPRPLTSFRGYLMAMAGTRALRELRPTERRVDTSPELALDDLAVRDAQSWADIERRVILGRQDLQRLSEALEDLDDVEREYLRLHYFEDLSYPEIGRRLGCSAQNAQQRIQRIIARIRAACDPKPDKAGRR